jgi:hypothetical protein
MKPRTLLGRTTRSVVSAAVVPGCAGEYVCQYPSVIQVLNHDIELVEQKLAELDILNLANLPTFLNLTNYDHLTYLSTS